MFECKESLGKFDFISNPKGVLSLRINLEAATSLSGMLGEIMRELPSTGECWMHFECSCYSDDGAMLESMKPNASVQPTARKEPE